MFGHTAHKIGKESDPLCGMSKKTNQNSAFCFLGHDLPCLYGGLMGAK